MPLTTFMNLIISLNSIELDILKYLFDNDVEAGYLVSRQTPNILNHCSSLGHEEEKTRDALLCLIDRDLLIGHFSLNRSSIPSIVSLTQLAFDEEIERRTVDYDQIKEKVGRYLASLSHEKLSKQEDTQIVKIAALLDEPFYIIRHMIGFFRKLGWVRLHREDSEYAMIIYVSPLLRRALNS